MSEAKQAGPRRPMFQFSLRTWLVLVTVVAGVVGWQSRRAVLTPKNIASLTEVATLDEDVWQIAWSPERDRLALLGWEKSAEIRDVLSLRKIDSIGKKLVYFAFSPDKDIVAYCQNGTTAEILDRRTGRSITLDAKNSQPQMTFSPDGTLLATGGYGTKARLWRVSDGEFLRELDTGPSQGGLAPVFSPDGKTLAVGNRNSTTILFDVATGRAMHILEKPESYGLQFSPDGRTLAVAYADGRIGLWNAADGLLLHMRRTLAEDLYRVEWSPDGQILASAGLKGKITLWNPADLTILREIDGPEWVIGLVFSPDGRNLITAGGPENSAAGKRSLKVWGIEGSLYTLANRPR
ncbi:MAG: translocation protein TolB [Planctomycetota bacterium]|nr:translocation protein TolB [Planctomycetota bacterium]